MKRVSIFESTTKPKRVNHDDLNWLGIDVIDLMDQGVASMCAEMNLQELLASVDRTMNDDAHEKREKEQKEKNEEDEQEEGKQEEDTAIKKEKSTTRATKKAKTPSVMFGLVTQSSLETTERDPDELPRLFLYTNENAVSFVDHTHGYEEEIPFADAQVNFIVREKDRLTPQRYSEILGESLLSFRSRFTGKTKKNIDDFLDRFANDLKSVVKKLAGVCVQVDRVVYEHYGPNGVMDLPLFDSKISKTFLYICNDVRAVKENYIKSRFGADTEGYFMWTRKHRNNNTIKLVENSVGIMSYLRDEKKELPAHHGDTFHHRVLYTRVVDSNLHPESNVHESSKGWFSRDGWTGNAKNFLYEIITDGSKKTRLT